MPLHGEPEAHVVPMGNAVAPIAIAQEAVVTDRVFGKAERRLRRPELL